MAKPIALFDCSGINALFDHAASDAIVTGMLLVWEIRLTDTCMGEVSATPCAARRTQLMQLCRRLVSSGEGVQEYGWIVREQARLHAASPESFDWMRLDVRDRRLEEEIARSEFCLTEAFSRSVRLRNAEDNKYFLRVWKEAREQFKSQFLAAEPVSIETIIGTFNQDDSPFMKYAADVYERVTGVKLSLIDMRAFVDKCPPLKAVLYSMCVAQYQWGVRVRKEPSPYKAGRLDLFSAAYLPYCDVFITRDGPQREALNVVAERAKLKTSVLAATGFLESLLVAGVRHT